MLLYVCGERYRVVGKWKDVETMCTINSYCLCGEKIKRILISSDVPEGCDCLDERNATSIHLRMRYISRDVCLDIVDGVTLSS